MGMECSGILEFAMHTTLPRSAANILPVGGKLWPLSYLKYASS
jgi:hypothetical protein